MQDGNKQLENERTLIAAIRRGEPQAWGGIYDLHANRLYRTILMPRLAEPTAAEDALAETFRTAIERFSTFSDQGHGMYPWLCRIAHNKAMDMHRVTKISGRRIHDLSQLLAPLSQPVLGAEEILSSSVHQRSLEQRLGAALDTLNPRYRRVIELRFFEERSRDQCALLMDVKVGTLDVLVLRALRALKNAWFDISPPSSGAQP